MKAWEKHQHDLYLLVNDIFETLFYQRHGYKASFYYEFNDKLEFLQSNGSRAAQLKLLQQLADMGAIKYDIRVPKDDIPDDFMSRGVSKPWKGKELVRLKLDAVDLTTAYKELKHYAPSGEQPLLQKHRRVYLQTDATQVLMVPTYERRTYPVGRFRAGGSPSEIISFIITRMPNSKINREILADNGYIYRSRKLNEMARGVFNELAYQVFVRDPKASSLTILNPVVIEVGTLHALIAESEN